MPTPLQGKSTVDEIRARFDRDVDRFSRLDTGQSATIDAPLTMALIAQAAVRATRPIGRLLDIGCGAGNNTLKLWEVAGHDFDVDLLDISAPMLNRAVDRISAVNRGVVRAVHRDFRHADLPLASYDVIVAAAVLHHLRDDEDWQAAFRKIFRLLAPGGSVWITDLVAHEATAVQELMWARYGEYLVAMGGEAYRDAVFDYVDREDSPRPLTYQLDLLRTVGFSRVDVLHKNGCFAAFGAIKAGS